MGENTTSKPVSGAEVVISAAERLLNDGKIEEANFTLLVGILRELGALRADASRT